MSTTVNHAIYYPAGNAAPNVPLAMQTAAESVDTALQNIKPVAAAVTAGAVQSIPNAVWTKLVYDTTELNNGTTIALGSGNVTVSEAGLYAITVSSGTQGTTAGAFGVRTEVGGVANANHLAAASPAGSSGSVVTYALLAANAVVSASVYQSSGAARVVTGARFSVVQVPGL